MTIQVRLAAVFRDCFELAPDAAVEDLAYRGLPAWDSVGHMRLVAAIESEFDILLETDDVLDLSSFGKGVEIVTRAAAAP